MYRAGELSLENDVCPHLLPTLCALLLAYLARSVSASAAHDWLHSPLLLAL